MNNGWIKAYRDLLNWQWHDDSEMMNLWMTLLLMANYEDSVQDGINVQRGQIKTSIKQLSIQTGITPKKIRGRIKGLTKGQYLVTETANDYTLITICNYDSYQSLNEDEGKQRANKGQTKGQTKGKQSKEERTKEEIYKEEKKNIKESTLRVPKKKDWRLPTSLSAQERMSALAEQIKPYVKDYGRDMCNDFYRYWITDQGSGVMLFEVTKKYPTFQVASRLATWYRKSSGRERSLPPQVEASLPSIDNVSVSSDAGNTMLSPKLLKELDEEYNLQDVDGECYSCLEDLKAKKNSKSERIEKEINRKRNQRQ